MRKIAIIAATLACLAGGSNAATLSLGSFGVGFYGNTVAVAPEATLTSFGTNFFFGGAYLDPGSFCAINGGSCNASLEIAFSTAVSALSFDVGGYDPGDNVSLDIFGLGNVLLGNVGITSNVLGLNLSSFGTITRLMFNDSSSGGGYGYANFRFDQVAAVPLPAGGLLLIGAIGGLVALRRRKAA